MFTFDNVITAGTVLIRQSIESQDFTPSGGTTGWQINADGTATFNNGTFRGTVLIGSLTGPHIISQTVPAPAFAFCTESTGTPGQTETKCAAVGALVDVSTGVPQMLVDSAITNNGYMLIALEPPHDLVTGIVIIATDTSGHVNPIKGLFVCQDDIQMRLLAGNEVGSGQAPLIIGSPTGVRTEYSADAIQAFNAGAASDLLLNPNTGARVQIRGGGTGWSTVPLILGTPTGIATIHHAFGIDAGNNGTLNQPLYLNNNSSQGIKSATMQTVGARNTGSATITATAFAKTLDAPVTLTLPPSGCLLISHACIITYPGSSKDFYQDFYIQNNTSATQVYNPSTNNGIFFNAGTTTISGGIRLAMTSVAASALGNPGDSITVGVAQQTSAAGSIPISRVWVSVTPSL